MSVNTNKFIELLEQNYNDAVKYSRALCSKCSADDAEDVLQQSLLKALENFDSLNEHLKFRSWLFTIITREFYSFVKKSFWKRFLPMDNAEFHRDIPEIYSRLEVYDNKNIISNALSKVSLKERAAILLFEIAVFSIDEITEVQNEKSISTIKSRLSRVRQKLKKYIMEADLNVSRNINTTDKNNFEDIENETIKLTSQYRTGKQQ